MRRRASRIEYPLPRLQGAAEQSVTADGVAAYDCDGVAVCCKSCNRVIVMRHTTMQAMNLKRT
jgi:hypothetical protein